MDILLAKLKKIARGIESRADCPTWLYYKGEMITLADIQMGRIKVEDTQFFKDCQMGQYQPLMGGLERRSMTDKEKLKKLFDEFGIGYEDTEGGGIICRKDNKKVKTHKLSCITFSFYANGVFGEMGVYNL